MRFRKTISICKGVRLNLSKSGVSCTVGGKGLSFNLGKDGVFMNTSIPGTGLYDRKRIAGGASASKRRVQADVRDFELELQENGAIEILRRGGGRVSESEERALRRTDWYDEESRALMQQFREKLDAQSNAFLTLHHYAKRVPARGEVEDEQTVEAAMDEWLGDLELPVDFDVQYEYNPETGNVMLDLDVPEIEDLPGEKAVELASGAVRSKAKTQRELKEEYRTCVLGLAVFFASHVFLSSDGIGAVLASGYTQRRDRRTGEREDCYIFSVAFERDGFKTDRCSREDPMDFCDRFRSRISMLASGELKEIVPYTPEEFEDMMS